MNLWKNYKDEPNDSITNSQPSKFKIRIIESTPDDYKKNDFKIAVPLEYLSNLRTALKMPFEVNLNLI